MRITTILLMVGFALVAYQSKAQPELFSEIEEILKSKQNTITLPEFLDVLGLDGANYLKNQTIESVDIENHQKFEFFHAITFRTTWFRFRFLTDNSHSMLYSAVELLGERSESQKVFSQVHKEFSHYVSKHEDFYKIKLDTYDEEMLPFIPYVFGTGCDWLGKMPVKCEKMMELVAQNDKKQLLKWVKSMNPSIQTYGVLGLYLLKKKNKRLSIKRKDKKLIEYVRQKDTVLSHCSELDPISQIRIKLVLTDSYMESVWYAFKNRLVD